MHQLILGRTRTGKTSLAKIMVRQAILQGRVSMIFDPVASRWEGTVYPSMETFVRDARKTENKLLVIDESAIALDRHDPEHLWLGQVSRHQGHASIYIGHNWTDVPKGIRTQCERIYLFACDTREAVEFSLMYGFPSLRTAWQLPKFHFFQVDLSDGCKVRRGRIDVNSGKIFRTA